MLVNFSNHPQGNWSVKQSDAAVQKYGEITDIPFPDISPSDDEKDIDTLACVYVEMLKTVLSRSRDNTNAVLIAGEFTFTFSVLEKLKKEGIQAVAATSRRDVIEGNDGTRTVRFSFERFRNYY